MTSTPLVLLILDGWGHRSDPTFNAIAAAKTPNWSQWSQTHPMALLECSGESVGLPKGQIGNSEVGHMHMGAGRTVHQSLTQINEEIEKGIFHHHPLLQKLFAQSTPIHLIGLLSPGGVHAHEAHFWAMIEMAKQYKAPIFVHAFLDGRDTPPKSAESTLKELQRRLAELKVGKIASICGRYYAMDRDHRFERTQLAYDLLTHQGDLTFSDPLSALRAAYDRGESDEFVKPSYCTETPIHIQEGDAVIFMNFRSDRARQLTQAFIDPQFSAFKREKHPKLSHFITLTEYDAQFTNPVLFPKETVSLTLGELLSKAQKKQLRIAETEKYAHVTYFFNCGIEQPWPGEDRLLIPSPKVKTYNTTPEMSAQAITDNLIRELPHYDVIICNFANPDMIGHTGDFEATVSAIECIDHCLGLIFDAVTQQGGEMLITSDHGNAELTFDVTTHQSHTAHTNNPVPFLYLGTSAKLSRNHGSLIDVAPTLLYLLGLEKPSVMSGTSLLI